MVGRHRGRSACFAGLVFLIQDAFPVADAVANGSLAGDRPQTSATSIFNDYVLPFEAISFLLLAALIGAIVLARKDDA